jgi:hypothetical protein
MTTLINKTKLRGFSTRPIERPQPVGEVSANFRLSLIHNLIAQHSHSRSTDIRSISEQKGKFLTIFDLFNDACKLHGPSSVEW